MKHFSSLVDLKAFVPSGDQDKYVFFRQYRLVNVYVWISGEWVIKRYFDLKNTSELIGYSVDEIRSFLAEYDQYITRRKKKGNIRLTYGNVLKIKYLMHARSTGHLEYMLATGKINNLYANKSDYHAI